MRFETRPSSESRSERSARGILIPGLVALLLGLGPLVAAPPAFAVSTSPQSQSFYDDALKYLETGEYQAAIIQLRNALQEDPNNREARLLLGRIRLDLGHADAAEKELRMALKLGHSDEAEVLLGRALLDEFRFEDVVRTVSRDALTTEALQEKLLLLAEAHWGLDQPQLNAPIYRQILQEDPNHRDARLGVARLYLASGQREEALREVDELLTIDAEFDPAWVFRGEVALLRNDTGAGLESFSKALEINPSNYRALVNRAWVRMRSGDWAGAAVDADEVLLLRPNDPFARYILAAVQFTRGNLVEASQSIQAVERYLEEERPVRLLGALIHIKLGGFATAERLLKFYLAKQPNNDDVRKLLAYVAMRNANNLLAVDTLEPLFRSKPNDDAAAQLLISAYLNLGITGKASWILQQVVERQAFRGESELRDTFVRLAVSAGVGGWEPDPESSLMPDDVITALFPILDLLRQGKIDDARHEVRLLKRRYPDTPFVLTLEGVVLLRQGETYSAQGAFEQALDFEPEFVPALENLDAMDRASEQPERIEERLHSLLRRAPRSELLLGRLIRVLSDDKRYDELEEFLEQKRSEMVRSILLARALIIVNLGRKDVDRVLQILEEILIVGADNPQDLLYARSMFLDLGKPERAIYASTLLQVLRPKSIQPIRLTAAAQQRAGKIDAAVASLEKAWSLQPGNTVVAGDMARLALEEEGLDAALEAAARLEPYNRAAAVKLRSEVFALSGQPDQALQTLEDAYEERPSPSLARNLLLVRIRTGQVEQGLGGMREWLAMRPDDVDSRFLFANTLMEQANLVEAAEEYESLVKLAPDNALALNNLAWLRDQLGQEGALELAARAYELAPDQASVADTYGSLLVQSEQTLQGVDVLRSAALLQSGQREGIRYRLASALASVGEVEEARAILKEILAIDRPFSERSEARKLLRELTKSH